MINTKINNASIRSFKNKNIVILGKTKAGKTFLAEWLVKNLPGHHVIHTDDFNKMPIDVAIKKMIRVTKSFKFCIIEGNLCYKLLLTGALNKTFAAGIIINLIISDETQAVYYPKRHNSLDLVRYFHEQDIAIFNEYLKLNKKAKVFNIENDNRMF